jgi:hypothetical protein
MENMYEFVIISIVALTIAMLAAYALKVAASSKGQANSATNDINEEVSKYSESEITSFNGMTIYGNEVIELVNQSINSSDYGTLVKTKSGAETCYYKSGRGSAIKVCYKRDDETTLQNTFSKFSNFKYEKSGYPGGNESGVRNGVNPYLSFNKEYINPDGMFLCKVYKSANGSATLLEFEQQ